MKDSDCTVFLRWALPRLALRWAGFRRVRGQVCKRVKRRMQDLGIEDHASYRKRLEADAEEWQVLDKCCHITISRFFRDAGIFEVLQRRVLPEIAERARRERRGAGVDGRADRVDLLDRAAAQKAERQVQINLRHGPAAYRL